VRLARILTAIRRVAGTATTSHRSRRCRARLLKGNQVDRADAFGAAEPTLDLNNPFPERVVIPFSDVIDLHSIPPRQINAVVEDYLEEANARGVRWLRIIHGKGIGVQRENVRRILGRSLYVVDYRDAPPEAGGTGATLVELGGK
jgi:dsDNA-specific endonuclease/ATPase MutS2